MRERLFAPTSWRLGTLNVKSANVDAALLVHQTGGGAAPSVHLSAEATSTFALSSARPSAHGHARDEASGGAVRRTHQQLPAAMRRDSAPRHVPELI